MAPLVSTKIWTKKEKTKQNVVSEAQRESSKSSKTLKRKQEVDDEPVVSEPQESKMILKKAKKDESGPSKSAKASKAVSKEREVAPEDVAEEDKMKKAAKEKKTPKTPSESAPEGKPKSSKNGSKPPPTPSISSTSISVTVMKKKSKGLVLEPESSSVEEDEDEEEGEDDGGHLLGFSTDDDSSDEEDAMDDEPSVFDVSKLPTIAKDDATVKHKLEKAKRQLTEDRGVLFIGRLPHGFYEDQLKSYFSQFGNVTRLRVSRNKKTGKSKHYGFIEFDSSSVARIVADTMDNYLIMGHILRCKLIPKDQVHPELWVGANRKWRVVPRDRLARVEHNKPRTESEQMRATKRLLKRQNERKRKLAQAGIKYDFEAVGYKANLVES